VRVVVVPPCGQRARTRVRMVVGVRMSVWRGVHRGEGEQRERESGCEHGEKGREDRRKERTGGLRDKARNTKRYKRAEGEAEWVGRRARWPDL
jgi:hypothetical protein